MDSFDIYLIVSLFNRFFYINRFFCYLIVSLFTVEKAHFTECDRTVCLKYYIMFNLVKSPFTQTISYQENSPIKN